MTWKTVACVLSLIASTAGCFAASEGDDAVVLARAGAGLSVDRYDVPVPIERPLPVQDLRLRTPGVIAAGVRFDPEEWEPNPAGGGCWVELARLWDPVREKEIEIPITHCN